MDNATLLMASAIFLILAIVFIGMLRSIADKVRRGDE